MNEIARLAMLRRQRKRIASRAITRRWSRSPIDPKSKVVERRLYEADLATGQPTRLIATARPGDTRWILIDERPG